MSQLYRANVDFDDHGPYYVFFEVAQDEVPFLKIMTVLAAVTGKKNWPEYAIENIWGHFELTGLKYIAQSNSESLRFLSCGWGPEGYEYIRRDKSLLFVGPSNTQALEDLFELAAREQGEKA